MSDAAALLAVNATFSSFGKAAIYVPMGGGDPVSCVVILDASDRTVDMAGVSASQVFAEGKTIEVRASEIAQPVRGGAFTIDAVDYTVQGDPKSADPDRLVWTCSVA